MTPRHLCLFCDNPADSKEDVLPVWIQEKVKGKRPVLVYGFSGERPITAEGLKSNVKTACVCYDCNTGWMSRLEGHGKQILGPLMEDVGFFLTSDQQLTVAKWAVKTAITAGSFNRKTRKLFYSRDECANFRKSWDFPPHTQVWLGRYVGDFDIGIFGIDGWDQHPKHPKVTHSYITTLVFKRVVIQLISIHARRDLQKGTINMRIVSGPWRDCLLEIRPSGSLHWPPARSFSDEGNLPLRSLVHRFSIGGSPTNPLRPDE